MKVCYKMDPKMAMVYISTIRLERCIKGNGKMITGMEMVSII